MFGRFFSFFLKKCSNFSFFYFSFLSFLLLVPHQLSTQLVWFALVASEHRLWTFRKQSLTIDLIPRFFCALLNCRKLPENWKGLHELAKVGQSAILKKTGTRYRLGNVASQINGTAAGGSPDYAFGVAKIPFVIAMEISGGSFHPPAGDIKRLVDECWIGIRAMCSFLTLKL